MLVNLVQELRERKQTLSTADLIAVETSARALAALRGRTHVWRRDLIDAVTSSLIKDELEYGGESPFVAAIHAVLRGRRRGRLAEGTRMPPLVLDIRRQVDRWQLTARTRAIVNGTRAVPQPLIRGTKSDRPTEIAGGRMIGVGLGVRPGKRHTTISAYLQDADSGSVVAVERTFADPDPKSGDLPRSFAVLLLTGLTHSQVATWSELTQLSRQLGFVRLTIPLAELTDRLNSRANTLHWNADSAIRQAKQLCLLSRMAKD